MNRYHLERALRKLRRLAEQGMLPPALEPLLMLSPDRNRDVEVVWRRIEDGTETERFDAQECGIWIEFHPDEGHHSHEREERFDRQDRPERSERDYSNHRGEPANAPASAIEDLVRTLDEAERSSNLPWIALKFLRDRLMPERARWAMAQDLCRDVIADGIARGIIKTNKKPNPRMPEFPVTAVTLDRAHAEVVQFLGVTETPVRAESDHSLDDHAES